VTKIMGSAELSPFPDLCTNVLAERRAELADFALRAKRTLRYHRTLPRRYTTIA